MRLSPRIFLLNEIAIQTSHGNQTPNIAAIELTT